MGRDDLDDLTALPGRRRGVEAESLGVRGTPLARKIVGGFGDILGDSVRAVAADAGRSGGVGRVPGSLGPWFVSLSVRRLARAVEGRGAPWWCGGDAKGRSGSSKWNVSRAKSVRRRRTDGGVLAWRSPGSTRE